MTDKQITWDDLTEDEQVVISELAEYTGSLGKVLYGGIDSAYQLKKKGLVAIRTRRERYKKQASHYYRLTELGREIAR